MSTGAGGGGQDFELNLAPIIDCFTVLIAFMLVSATFLAIGIFDAGIAAAGAKATNATPPPIQISLHLKPDHSMSLQVTGKVSRTLPVAPEQDSYGYAALANHLKELRRVFPTVGSLTLKADDGVEYKEVIKTMEHVRANVPLVLLGGF